jgi:hypothetical protein
VAIGREFEIRIWKDIVVTYRRFYPDIRRERMKKAMNSPTKSNCVPDLQTSKLAALHLCGRNNSYL